jgi:hypothetical protein
MIKQHSIKKQFSSIELCIHTDAYCILLLQKKLCLPHGSKHMWVLLIQEYRTKGLTNSWHYDTYLNYSTANWPYVTESIFKFTNISCTRWRQYRCTNRRLSNHTWAVQTLHFLQCSCLKLTVHSSSWSEVFLNLAFLQVCILIFVEEFSVHPNTVNLNMLYLTVRQPWPGNGLLCHWIIISIIIII